MPHTDAIIAVNSHIKDKTPFMIRSRCSKCSLASVCAEVLSKPTPSSKQIVIVRVLPKQESTGFPATETKI